VLTPTAARIGIYLPALNVGGVERMLLGLARGFLERGRPVDLVLHTASGRLLDAVPAEARTIILSAGASAGRVAPARRVVPPMARLGRLVPRVPLWRVYPYVPRLARYLRTERPAVLLAALASFNLAALWARQRAGSGTRVVITERANVSEALAVERMTLARWILRPLMRRYYPRADAIVAVSRGVADDLARFASLSRAGVRVIYNPVVGADLPRMADEPVDHPWFRPDELPVILGAGRLSRQKDFPTLIRAFAEVRRARPARLVILGDGAQRADLEALVRTLGLADAVALPGFTSNPYAHMARAAVFVLSSRFEGFPNVLVEALAVGTPVVATDCPSGPAEILEGGRHGRLVPVGQADALARALLATLDAPGDPAGRRRRAADFSADASVSTYLELFDSLEAPIRS
jgi:glycosyltransferase involved in cell wall biosynthesis